MTTSNASYLGRMPALAISQGLISLRWVLLVILLALTGCATQQIGHDFDATKITQFKPNQTTMDEVIATLGQPMERETESDGSVRLHYQWVKGKGDVSDYIPVVSLFKTGTSTDGKDAFLYFDRAGRYVRAETNEMHTSS